MAKKNRDQEELDMETTVVDMNVEGFHWYDPSRKKGKREAVSLTKKEQRALLHGAIRALFPMIACILISALLMILFAYVWLK